MGVSNDVGVSHAIAIALVSALVLVLAFAIASAIALALASSLALPFCRQCAGDCSSTCCSRGQPAVSSSLLTACVHFSELTRVGPLVFLGTVFLVASCLSRLIFVVWYIVFVLV